MLLPHVNEFMKTHGAAKGGSQCTAELAQLVGEFIASLAINAKGHEAQAFREGLQLALDHVEECAQQSYDNQREWRKQGQVHGEHA